MIVSYFAISLFVLTFFVLGVYSMVFMLKTPKLQVENKHWTIKLFWWFGAYFFVLIAGGSILGLALTFTAIIIKFLKG